MCIDLRTVLVALIISLVSWRFVGFVYLAPEKATKAGNQAWTRKHSGAHAQGNQFAG